MRLLVLALSLLLAACGTSQDSAPPAAEPATEATTAAAAGHDHAAHADATYACPMHPEITGAKGDRCSKCNMFLTESGKGMPAEGAAKAADEPAAFYCPMHPEVTADEAGQRCGKCNMFLVAPGDEDKHTGG